MTATATATVNTKGLIGQIIGDGRYDLRELLGGGSMGYVYRAFDRRLETDVVVKIPRRHKLESPDSLRRFRQESKFLVKLNHPHVVSILDVGEYDGVPFFVMPFINGGSLRSRQKNEHGVQKPLKSASLRSWLREIAKALDYIHSQNCIHRDVKPDNILFDEHGHAFLGDFGLSKVVSTSESDDPSQTVAGAIVGTPLFTAPELVLGEPADGRADQYSLALTVYDSLAGTNPFEGPNSSATLVNQTAIEPPLLTELNPTISPVLSRIVRRGLSKFPDERFPSCVAFAEAVLAVIPASGPSRSSGMHASPQSVARRSSESNSLTDTTGHSQSVRRPMVSKSPTKVTPKSGSPTSDGNVVQKARFVVVARTPIVKAKCNCPKCARDLFLQPAFAGKRATCQTCACRLLIAPDFSELRMLEPVAAVADADPLKPRGGAKSEEVASAASGGEFDLVLGQEVFGWKLNRKWALSLAALLVLFLVLMAMFLTNQSSQSERERLRDQYRPRSMEGN
ncbi:MAG: serine/threonine protein kinase [Planctomycetaceae bacterium]